MAKELRKRAAIYIRCSSDEAKKEGYSPKTQREKLEEFVERNGWQLDKQHIYDEDIGFSGGSDKRPGLQRLLREARNKEFDIVVVYRLDRFFRNLRLLLNTLEELKTLGVDFKSATESFDTATLSGEVTLTALGMAADLVRKITMGSRNEGMIKAMKEGKWLGGTPTYGYRLNKETQKLEINEEEAAIVRMFFGWLIDDKLSEYKIQQKINAMKIPTKFDNLGRDKKTKSKCWWNRRAIGRILRNEIYTGIFYYRKYKYLGRVKGQSNLRPREEWIKVEDPALQIIKPELFEKALQQLKKNKEMSPRNTKQVYALQHKMVCGFDSYCYQCATRYYFNRHGHSETKYYFCSGNRGYFTPNRCSAPSISESRILPPVWEKLKETLENPKAVMQDLNDYLSRGNRKNQIQEELISIRNSLDSSDTSRERYAELYAEGSIKKEFYDKKIQECERETERIRKEEKKLSQLLLTEEEKEKRTASARGLYRQLKEYFENDITYEIKRGILQRLVGKIIKTDDKLDIEFDLPFTYSPLQLTPKVCSDSRRMDRNFQPKRFRG